MKNIIEKEIDRRETLIAEKAKKEARYTELQLECEQIASDIAGIDEVALRAEISELETYLPKPIEEPVCGESVETEPTSFTY